MLVGIISRFVQRCLLMCNQTTVRTIMLVESERESDQ